MKYNLRHYMVLFALAFSFNAQADGLVVDKIYHPYVLPLEQEIEWRFTLNEKNDYLDEENHTISQRLGYGKSISDEVIIEAHIVGLRIHDAKFALQSYEVEVRWMITEQGQYPVDWGMLFEVGKEHGEDIWESKIGALAETEIGRTSLTANLFTTYEYGGAIDNELEIELNLQYRYRYRPIFQPAVELYLDESFVGLGPALMGVHHFESQKQIKWEAGLIFGLTDDSNNHTLRIGIEYEF